MTMKLFVLTCGITLSAVAEMTVMERIDSHVGHMSSIQRKAHYVPVKQLGTVSDQIDMEQFTFFSHELVTWCLKKMEYEHTLEPFFDIWYDYKRHHDPHGEQDEQFLKECSLLILMFYNRTLISVQGYDVIKTQPSPKDVILLFDRVSRLPISELLNVLDTIFSEIQAIAAEHPMQTLTLVEWLHTNWWVPPTIIAGIIAAAVLR